MSISVVGARCTKHSTSVGGGFNDNELHDWSLGSELTWGVNAEINEERDRQLRMLVNTALYCILNLNR